VTTPARPASLPLPGTFGDALRFLRKRAQLTQDELGRSVGYSREQIARLENGSRLPDLAVVAALFIPALFLEREAPLVEQFLNLAGKTRTVQQITVTRTRQTRLQLASETVFAADVPAHYPPAPLLPLIGREAEVCDLLAVLQTARLVTLLGAPGIGKSRLALEVAQRSMSNFSDGVAFIPLADVATPDDVPYAVLRALSLTPAAHQSVEAAIEAYLAPRCLLLILDNCEHVLNSIPLFADWLARAPRLNLLCTSRVPLDLYGEQEWPLAPLPVPDLAQLPDLETWSQLPALQLLCSRVRAATPTFALTPENLLPLATLCVALDGLPLALELAAVRLRELSPEVLVQQLLTQRGNGQLSSTWLQQTRRNIADRHRTLQAAIAWSVRMLTPAQQDAFCRLGVFVGGCSEAAAQAVAADSTIVAQLARANLVNVVAGRITLLETLRDFASEQLVATAQLQVCQGEHAAYYTAFAQQVFTGLLGDDQAAWMQRALADHDNCLAALRWAISQDQGPIAIALAGSLWWFWCRRGLFSLGQEMLATTLQLSTPDRSARATALNGLASIYLAQDEYAASLACHREGLSLRREIGDTAGIATVLHNMGLTAYMMGDYPQALTWLDESIAADLDSDPMQAWAHKGIIALDMLDCFQARSWLECAYELVRQQQAGWAQAFVMHNLADVLRETGELATAKQLAQTSLRLFETLGDSYYLPDPQLVLAQIAGDEGDYAVALALAELALTQYEARQDVVLTASVQLFQAEVACKMGEYDQAAAQFKRAYALRQTIKRPLTPREQTRYQSVAQACRGPVS
jgi:predicted ATPase/transcriptional regulator with XRE-family HTH domain